MIIGRTVPVIMYGHTAQDARQVAKVDTGAYSSSIDARLAEYLGLVSIGSKTVKSALGESERPTATVTIRIGTTSIVTEVSISDRSNLKHLVLLGRKDIARLGALVDVSKKGIVAV